MLLHEKGLTPGTEYKARVFKARLAQAIKEKISIGQSKMISLPSGAMGLTEITMVETLPDGEQRTSTSYVDNSFRAHKSKMSVGDLEIELYRCSKESALKAAAPLDLLTKMLIPSPERIYNLEQAPAMTYTLIPAQGADSAIPALDGQKVTRLWDGKITVEIRPVAGPTWATFPYQGNKITLREAVRPTQYLQSDRKEVIDLARKAVGNTRSSVEAVQRIESFVAQYIEKWSMMVGYASAAEVIESREGDCTEFAVLTAALCRAVGIPAQVVVGVAYTNDFAGRCGFAGHAWTQAYIGNDAQGVWVSVDAAYKHGGGGYDAGHIALAVGGDPTDFSDVAALDQFTVDKIQIHRRESEPDIRVGACIGCAADLDDPMAGFGIHPLSLRLRDSQGSPRRQARCRLARPRPPPGCGRERMILRPCGCRREQRCANPPPNTGRTHPRQRGRFRMKNGRLSGIIVASELL